MNLFKSHTMILAVMLLFAGQVLAEPFLICEDMRNPVDAAMADSTHGDAMMPASGMHAHDMHDMAAHDHGAGMAMASVGAEHGCAHLCNVCLVSASLVGFPVAGGIKPVSSDALFPQYQLLLPSSPVDLLFRPPIFA